MIIKKNDDGTYVCEVEGQYFTIGTKESYLAQKADIESMKQPTDKELIELAKRYHPYYQKDTSLNNVNNQLAEMEVFDGGSNNI